MLRVVATAMVALAFTAAGCGSDDGDTATPPASGDAPVECASVEQPEPRTDGGQRAPTERLDPSRTWTLTFDTSCGTFVVTLDLESAPLTSASLVSLARAGFFDDTLIHRVVPGFVIQGGDPTQSGGGGPGYSTVDAPPAGTRYLRGVVAMAKTTSEPPGTAGSQFFVVTGEDIGLPAEYAVVGNVTDGLEVVERIGELGDAATERPLQPIVVESVIAKSS